MKSLPGFTERYCSVIASLIFASAFCWSISLTVEKSIPPAITPEAGPEEEETSPTYYEEDDCYHEDCDPEET